MAITTLDGALAGMVYPKYFAKAVTPTLVAGRPHSTWYLAGAPGAGTMDTATSGGVALSSSSALVNGQIPFYNPGAGFSYLARLQAMATIGGTLLLCDRLWHGAYQTTTSAAIVVTSTSAQTIGSATLPARDADGSTNGKEVLAALEIYAATGAGTPTITLGYTNSAGGTGKSAVNVDPVVASGAIGAFYRLGLQAGDVGVRQINTVTLSATMTSGNVGLVLYRVLAALELTVANTPNAIDALTGGFTRLYDGTVPFLVFVPSTTTASNISGQMIVSQG